MTERTREQFDEAPYPSFPVAHPLRPCRNYKEHLSTPFYLRDRKHSDWNAYRVLDAGCGSGYGTMCLALSHPECTFLGVDWSEQSISLARRRNALHRLPNVQFLVGDISSADTERGTFDVIVCQDVLYLVDDVQHTLNCLSSLLSPSGVIRVSLHNVRQRARYLQTQGLLRSLGILDRPNAESLRLTKDLFRSLRPTVPLKASVWPRRGQPSDSTLLANHLLRGDKGFSLPEVFALLASCDLHLIDMVDRGDWSLDAQFNSGSAVLETVKLALSSYEDYLCVCDLLMYNQRLYDVWACHRTQPIVRSVNLDDDSKRLCLNPVLAANGELRRAWKRDAASLRALAVGPTHTGSRTFVVAAPAVACLCPLWDGPMSVAMCKARWNHLFPHSSSGTEGDANTKHPAEIVLHLTSLECEGIVCLTD